MQPVGQRLLMRESSFSRMRANDLEAGIKRSKERTIQKTEFVGEEYQNPDENTHNSLLPRNAKGILI